MIDAKMSTMSRKELTHVKKKKYALVDNKETGPIGGVIAKLRRLKMQENVIFNNVRTNSDFNHFNNHLFIVDSKRKIFLERIKKNFREIKHLYEDIKYSTNPQDFKHIDIEQIKKDVILLEEKISNFKQLLNTQMSDLRSTEEKLLIEINDASLEIDKPTKDKATKIKSFNDIVPSPVKAIIHTPYKYKEVQQLQEFLFANGGRFGGWHEYKHNLFLQSRNKYIKGANDELMEGNRTNYESLIKLLVKELLQKIPGISEENILEHERWYKKFLLLNEEQRGALNKWKECKKYVKGKLQKLPEAQDHNNINANIKKDVVRYFPRKFGNTTNNNVVQECLDEIENDMAELFIDDTNIREIEGQPNKIKHRIKKVSNNLKKKSTFTNTTEQWNNRCLLVKEDIANVFIHNYGVNNVMKYGIPKWRRCLTEQ